MPLRGTQLEIPEASLTGLLLFGNSSNLASTSAAISSVPVLLFPISNGAREICDVRFLEINVDY